MNTTEFEEGIRRALVVEKLRASVTEWLSVSDKEIEQEYRRRNDKVKLAVASILSDSLRGTVSASDAEVSTYFEAHTNDFRIPEKRKIRYLLVDTDAMRAKIVVPAADVERAYNDNFEQYSTPEQIRASHILLKTAGKDEAAVRAQAEGLLKQARAGADFAQLATKNSEDEGTAAKGRRLGLLRTRPHGPGIRRRGVRAAAAGTDQRPGQDAVSGFTSSSSWRGKPGSTRPSTKCASS